MYGGYAGRVLWVDLTTGRLDESSWSESDCRRFIGGYALAAKALLRDQPGGVDPLGPQNILAFVTGPLTGTAAPMSGRFMVACKSPLTGAWAGANCGGHFGPALKRAGYDAIFLSGVASQPVYLALRNGDAELKCADHVWGKDTYDTEDVLREECGDAAQVACIGPAGEARSLISCIITDKGRAAGRCGVGAVMGSKMVKAIVATGDIKTPVADAPRLTQLAREFNKWVRGADSGMAALLKNQGTPGQMEGGLASGACPIKNWQRTGLDAFPNYAELAGVAQDLYKVKRYGCANCSVKCGAILEMPEGEFALASESHRAEYETLAGFGSQCLNGNLRSVIKANDICNRAGLDTISASSTVAFAMECFDRGILTTADTGGLDLTWGNASALVELVEQMADRSGFGALLADGSRKAASLIGAGADQYSMDVGGQEVAYQHSRYLASRATGYVVDAAPGRHMAASGMVRCELGGSLAPYEGLESADVSIERCGGRGPQQVMGSDFLQAYESAGMCILPLFFGPHPFLDCLEAVTGLEWGAEDVLSAGARGMTLRHVFNLREGFTPSDFVLPDRLASGEDEDDGPLAGIKMDMDTLTREYYEARGWDLTSGLPSWASLERLGLVDLVVKAGVNVTHPDRPIANAEELADR